jgi:hypothetical protein
MTRVLKDKTCRQCKQTFKPSRPLQSVCTLACALSQSEAKRLAQEAKVARKANREARERIKTKSQWLKETQAEFNKFIRARDHDKPCISCGRHHSGQYHAGHYRTDKALRFNEIACFKQCMPCNTHLSGNQVKYRAALVGLLGDDLVAWLDKDHSSPKWTIDELRYLKAYYRQRAKEAEKWAHN